MPTSGSTTYERRFYTYDPFGRLTAVHSNDAQTTLIAEYRYNGLGQRIMWRYDADASLSVGSTESYYYMYDGPAGGMHGWRMVGTFRDADASPKESFVYHAAGMAGRVGGGSSSYIDAVVMRDRDANAGWTAASDGTLEERRYFTQNWRADVVAVTKSNGDPMEFTFYSAYGEATVHPVADVDLDGDVDSADSTCWDNGDNTGPLFAYTSTDLNFDGVGDAADDALFDAVYAVESGRSGVGKVSSKGVASRKGFAGYEHDESIVMYHVRNRVYRPDLGRWMSRDPLGYVDGMGLYEYVRGMAVVGGDPSGLATAVPGSGGDCGGPSVISGRSDSYAGVANVLTLTLELAQVVPPGIIVNPPPIPPSCVGTISPAEWAGAMRHFAIATSACGVPPIVVCGPCAAPAPGMIRCGSAALSPRGAACRVTICTGNPPGSCGGVLVHELTHCRQSCDVTPPGTPLPITITRDERLCREIEAYKAGGSCSPTPGFTSQKRCLCQRACGSIGGWPARSCIAECITRVYDKCSGGHFPS